jgi:outer membrane protein W
MFNYNIPGIGGDIQFKYDFTEKYYINFGISVSYNFFGYTEKYHYSEDGKVRTTVSSDWGFNHSMVNIKPYIGIGFNYYQEKGVYGKPK